MRKLRVTVDGKTYDVVVEFLDEAAPVSVASAARATVPTSVSAPGTPLAASVSRPAAEDADAGEAVQSQVSGVVVRVDVKAGDSVEAQQQLFVIEAMKMNTYVLAPHAGTVAAVLTEKGKSVLAGDVLARLA